MTPTWKTLTIGTAAIMLGIGMPYVTEAGGSKDWSYKSKNRQEEGRWIDRDRYQNDYSWGEYGNYGSDDADIDSHVRSDRRIYSSTSDRNRHNRDRGDEPYFTDAHGDLDTMYEDKDPYPYDGDTRYRSSSRTHQRDMSRSDESLRQEIMDELGEGTDRVRVSVRNGVATLSGMVLNREAMVEAEEAAYDAGAQRVRNEMQVFRHDDRPWAEMSDRQLAKDVREEISWSPFVDEDPIRVTARRGVVTLEGTVENRSEMAAAVENAYEAGARRVDNRLRIGN